MKAGIAITAIGMLLLSGCTDVSVDDEQQASTTAKAGTEPATAQKPDKPLGPDRQDYKTAYTSLQKAVAAGDKTAASSLVSYPLVVSQGGAQKTITTPNQFVAEYDTIITPSVHEVIVEHDFDTVVGSRYDRADDTDLFVAGALLGAVVEGVARSWGRRYSTNNNYYYQGYADYYYDGCHGIGCLVDTPPPVSTYDNYTGCRGEGCLVDDPDTVPDFPTKPDAFMTDDPPEPGQTELSDGSDDASDDPPEPGQAELSDDSDDASDAPPEPGQTELSDDSDDASDAPPEPGQTALSDDSDAASDAPPEPGQAELSDDSDDASDDNASSSDDDSSSDDSGDADSGDDDSGDADSGDDDSGDDDSGNDDSGDDDSGDDDSGDDDSGNDDSGNDDSGNDDSGDDDSGDDDSGDDASGDDDSSDDDSSDDD